MLPKLENKTQTGTIVYIVVLIINCSTYVYNIYTVENSDSIEDSLHFTEIAIVFTSWRRDGVNQK